MSKTEDMQSVLKLKLINFAVLYGYLHFIFCIYFFLPVFGVTTHWLTVTGSLQLLNVKELIIGERVC